MDIQDNQKQIDLAESILTRREYGAYLSWKSGREMYEHVKSGKITESLYNKRRQNIKDKLGIDIGMRNIEAPVKVIYKNFMWMTKCSTGLSHLGFIKDMDFTTLCSGYYLEEDFFEYEINNNKCMRCLKSKVKEIEETFIPLSDKHGINIYVHIMETIETDSFKI